VEHVAILAGGWLLVAGFWLLVGDGWWLVTSGWPLFFRTQAESGAYHPLSGRDPGRTLLPDPSSGICGRRHVAILTTTSDLDRRRLTTRGAFVGAEYAKPRCLLLTGAAKRRIIRQHLATNFEVVKIMYRLFFAPRAQCISRYSEQVGLGAT